MEDVDKLLELIEPYVDKDLILKRTREDLLSLISEFIFIKKDKRIIACAGLKKYDNNIAEIYCIAVAKDCQNKGYSKKLLAKVFAKACEENIKKIFALSKYGAKWFLHHGFKEASFSKLPEAKKIVFDKKRNPRIFIKYV